MAERFCVRGCTKRGDHWAACPDYGRTDGDCRGCEPYEARDGVLICERCYRSLRRHLEDAADLVGHLRSIADPTKAMAIARTRTSIPELPAPVAADLIDASDDIVRMLRSWALYVELGPGHERRAAGLAAGIGAAAAYDDAHRCADVILAGLDKLANDSHQVGALCDGVIVVHQGEPAVWTIADAAVRWPLDDQPRWAAAPCPDCDLMAVRVQPSRGRRPTRYRCTTLTCAWEANAADDRGLWASYFEDPVVVIEDKKHPKHDQSRLTIAAAARLVKRTTGTVRRWITAGDLDREDGRVRESEVLAVAARKRGDTA